MTNHARFTMRSTFTALAAATVACATPTFASNPDFTDVLPAGIACDFELQIEGWTGNAHGREFTDRDGNVVRVLATTTQLVLRLTNTSNDASLTIPLNGSIFHTTIHGDGTSTIAGTGHALFIFFPADSPPTSTILVSGRVVVDVDASNVWTLRSVKGRQTDICDALS